MSSIINVFKKTAFESLSKATIVSLNYNKRSDYYIVTLVKNAFTANFICVMYINGTINFLKYTNAFVFHYTYI